MDRHLNEQLNRRAVYLRTLRKLWVIPAAALVGALLGLLIYTAAVTVISGHRQYEQTNKFYIEFAYDERGNAYDYYNAATWDDLLFAHPDLWNTIEEGLPEGMTKEQARAYVLTDLYSDIRLMTVIVTTPTAEGTQQLSQAIRNSLERFGAQQKEFDEIRFLSATEPKLIVVSDKTGSAVMLGAFLGLLISGCLLLLLELLDDAVYVPEDAARRYGLPVLGVLAADGQKSSLPAVLQGELEQSLSRMTEGKEFHSVQVLDITAQMQEMVEHRQDATVNRAAEQLRLLAPEVLTEEERDSKIVILHYGQQSGSAAEHILSRLQQEGSTILGTVIADADAKFLTRYYENTDLLHLLSGKIRKIQR